MHAGMAAESYPEKCGVDGPAMRADGAPPAQLEEVVCVGANWIQARLEEQDKVHKELLDENGSLKAANWHVEAQNTELAGKVTQLTGDVTRLQGGLSQWTTPGVLHPWMLGRWHRLHDGTDRIDLVIDATSMTMLHAHSPEANRECALEIVAPYCVVVSHHWGRSIFTLRNQHQLHEMNKGEEHSFQKCSSG
jgi:hypothetical protein